MPTQKPRCSLVLDEELLEKIEDFRFSNRYNNRNSAVIELIKLGFKQLEEENNSKKDA